LVTLDGAPIAFNEERPWVSGAIAVADGFERHLEDVMSLASRQAVLAID
jgi:hypothetical protein